MPDDQYLSGYPLFAIVPAQGSPVYKGLMLKKIFFLFLHRTFGLLLPIHVNWLESDHKSMEGVFAQSISLSLRNVQ